MRGVGLGESYGICCSDCGASRRDVHDARTEIGAGGPSRRNHLQRDPSGHSWVWASQVMAVAGGPEIAMGAAPATR